MKQVDIGLDIGIASVGWCITTRDEKHEIIKHGVRLFNTVDDPKDSKLLNETRRDARSMRRQISRRITRRRDFFKLLITHGLSDIKFDDKSKFVEESLNKFIRNVDWLKKIDKESEGLGIFQLRKKGLTQKLETIELINVLYWYINHRGFKYETPESDEKGIRSKYKEYTETGESPIDMQLSYYQKNGFLNGAFNRIFKNEEYEIEIKQILSRQKLNQQFIEEYISLFNRQRSFEEGPGDGNTKTPFGRFYEMVGGKLEKRDKPYETVWEKTVGHCSIYTNEFRAPKMSLSSELFNLLNDLNNVTVFDERLTNEYKIEVIKIALKTKSHINKTLDYLKNTFNLDASTSIMGFRIDKTGERIITNLDSFHEIKKHLTSSEPFDEIFQKNLFNDKNIYDKISNILSQTTIVENRLKEFKNNLPHLSEIQMDELSRLKGFSQTHALSLKALHQFIPIMLIESKNQSEIRHELNLTSNDKFKIGEYLDASWTNDVITTPTVKRALRQTLKVLSAIFEFCKDQYEVKDIVIEMAREKKNKEAKELETQLQKIREEANKNIGDYLKGLDVRGQTFLKIWLLIQQNKHDAYTGEKIEVEDIASRPFDFDIDHIIPDSQSFDDSRNNKVLTRKTINSEKGNRTPFQYLNSKGTFEEMSSKWEEWYNPRWNKNDREAFASRTKLQNLTSKLDFSKPENQIGFIQRNLVDTRYTTKELIEYLLAFKEKKKLTWKVKTINGRMTSFIRKKMENDKSKKLFRPEGCGENFDVKTGQKNRIWHGHHAEDAYIITLLNYFYKDQKIIESALSSPRFSPLQQISNPQLIKKFDAGINTKFSDFVASIDFAREELNNKIENLKFSRMIEKKSNKKLFNESLYRGKKVKNNETGKDELIKSHYLILMEENQEKLSKFFGYEAMRQDDLDIYKCDKKAYDALQEIYLSYFKENKNTNKPFEEACKDAKKPFVEISYLANNGNNIQGRIIKKLRYNSSAKNEQDIIKAPNNGDSFYESLEWLRLEIYKNKKGKWCVIPITATNSTFGCKQDKNSLKLLEYKKRFEVDPNDKPTLILNKYDCLKDKDGGIWYVVGHSFSRGQIEIKPIWRKKIESDKSQTHKTLNTSLRDWKFVKLTILGDIKETSFVF